MWAKITPRTPVYRRGGGALKLRLEATGRGAREAVGAIVVATMETVVEESIRDGWPVGPERPWDNTWRGHSIGLFEVTAVHRGFVEGAVVTNAADYAMFIHAPGDPGEIVWRREILDRIQEALPDMKAKIGAAIAAKFNGGGR